MVKIYNIVISILESILCFVKRHPAPLRWLGLKQKAVEFVTERDDQATISAVASIDHTKKVYWFHAASLGEYGIIRPIIKELKRKTDSTVVLTFFSMTGYNTVMQMRRSYAEVDHVFMLPIDTRRNARGWVKSLRPDKVVIAVSDLWPNFMDVVSEQKIDSYLISAVLRKSSTFFRWYGSWHRHMLRNITKVCVLDKMSLLNGMTLGLKNMQLCSNPLYDNAIAVAESEYRDEEMERFCQTAGGGVFVAGSISDEKDLALVASLANKNRDTRFIIVPHEINQKMLDSISASIEGNVMRHSECNAETDFNNCQVLVIDFVGALARLYRYGKWAYVGGGFTPLLHSVIEATVYGLPVAFGPCIERQLSAKQIYEAGLATIVNDETELQTWFEPLKNDNEKYERLRRQLKDFTYSNRGATEKLVEMIVAPSVTEDQQS